MDSPLETGDDMIISVLKNSNSVSGVKVERTEERTLSERLCKSPYDKEPNARGMEKRDGCRRCRESTEHGTCLDIWPS